MNKRFINHSIGFQYSPEEFIQISLYQEHNGQLNGAGLYRKTLSDPNAGHKNDVFETLDELAKIAGFNADNMKIVLAIATKLVNTPVRNEHPINV